ncbi:glucose 1-dehydrogenase [Virgibacillus halodenitrificans]|uniref:SDR family NAD(P)-dependent oxidoreductase n=1 Tax=Virgibacillus halodenitrificans TaxID=1482 RepID=UPI00136AEA02|nr:SDR family NAD(P)-dependent oxidoreductase [Virgibacillus halodenitrificans]MYL46707.1 glucose 1-dehydrogenase [Virgibacillus halodenitrificans]
MNYEELIGLKNKVVVITGAASGIGLETSKLFSSVGCQVIMLDINSETGTTAAKEIEANGGKATFLQCDVTSNEACKSVVEAIESDYQNIDVLFNNAGVIRRQNTVEHSEEDWDLVLDVSLKSVFLLSKYIIPLMAKNGGGSIINTGSGWGLKGGDNAVSYCAAKAGVVNISKAMAIDHGKDNIRVNCICPGDTDTPLLRSEAEQLKLDEKEFLVASGVDRPLRRIGTPEDIAKGVLYLASDMSAWVSGTTLVVDGGGLA